LLSIFFYVFQFEFSEVKILKKEYGIDDVYQGERMILRSFSANFYLLN